MRPLIILTALLVFVHTLAPAQYKLRKFIYYPARTHLPSQMLKTSLHLYKGGDIIYTATLTEDSIFISKVSLTSGEGRTYNYELIKKARGFDPRDCFVSNGTLFLSQGSSSLFSIDLLTGRQYLKEYKDHKFEFEKGYALSSGNLLLYKCYGFHPADGGAGLFLNIYNPKSRKVTIAKTIPWEGVAVSKMTKEWVCAQGDEIIAVKPFADKVYTFNDKLELVDSFELNLLRTKQAGIRLIQYLEDTTLKERLRLQAVINRMGRKNLLKRGGDSLQSPVYSNPKDFFQYFSDTIRKSVDYIEKLFPVGPNKYALTINRAGYGLKYRDLYFIDTKHKQVTQGYERWQCRPLDTLRKPEDYFVADLINEKNLRAAFVDERTFVHPVRHPIEEFKPGPKEEMDALIYKSVKKRGLQWELYLYEIEQPLR